MQIKATKFRQLVKWFALDLTATNTAKLIGISVRSVNSIYLGIRLRMAEDYEVATPLKDAVDVDESYFGVHRVRGKHGRRGAYGKTIVFGFQSKLGSKIKM